MILYTLINTIKGQYYRGIMRAKRQLTDYKNDHLNLVMKWINHFTNGNLSHFCEKTGIDKTTAFSWKREEKPPANKSIKRILAAFGLSEEEYWLGPDGYKEPSGKIIFRNNPEQRTCPVYSFGMMREQLENSLIIGFTQSLDNPDYFVLYIDVQDIEIEGFPFHFGTKHLVKKCNRNEVNPGDTVLVYDQIEHRASLLRYGLNTLKDEKNMDQYVIHGYVASMQLKPTPAAVLSNFVSGTSAE